LISLAGRIAAQLSVPIPRRQERGTSLATGKPARGREPDAVREEVRVALAHYEAIDVKWLYAKIGELTLENDNTTGGADPLRSVFYRARSPRRGC
jgi:hypothetical protein